MDNGNTTRWAWLKGDINIFRKDAMIPIFIRQITVTDYQSSICQKGLKS
jgi:hypothetical protein